MADNPLRIDPTKTGLIVRRFEGDIKKRILSIRKAVFEHLVANREDFEPKGKLPADLVLGMPPVVTNAAYQFQTSDEKLKQFAVWLQGQLDEKLLTIEPDGFNPEAPWLSKYISSSYLTAVNQGFFKAKAGDDKARAEFVRQSFSPPESLDKVRLLYTRTFNEMQGLSTSMKTALSRELANGLAHGLSVRKIASNISAETDLSISRSRRIARTEIIRAHAEGTLDSFTQLGIAEVGLLAEWSTAGDARVCAACDAMAAQSPYTIEQARGLIPLHPSCRCSWTTTADPAAKRIDYSKYNR